MQNILMYETAAPEILKLLAHDVRWAILAELARSDRRVGELVRLAGRPQNLISYHLGLLREGELVREHRSSADARDIYYSLDVERLGELYRLSGRVLHPSIVAGGASLPPAGRPLRILFLCTHNSARSQMAEALMRRAAGQVVIAASAGSEPSAVHPLAVMVMAERGIDIGGQRSKDMAVPARQHWDIVVTVCDRVREVCPTFPEETRAIHWSIRDPVAVSGTEAERLAAFRTAAEEIGRRAGRLCIELGIRL